jgi:hypothetical protein
MWFKGLGPGACPQSTASGPLRFAEFLAGCCASPEHPIPCRSGNSIGSYQTAHSSDSRSSQHAVSIFEPAAGKISRSQPEPGDTALGALCTHSLSAAGSSPSVALPPSNEPTLAGLVRGSLPGCPKRKGELVR